MNKLEQFKEELEKEAFGTTKAESHTQGLCIQCKEPALPKCYSDAGRREYRISGVCEDCFDKMFAE
jgi:hypothetical protein